MTTIIPASFATCYPPSFKALRYNGMDRTDRFKRIWFVQDEEMPSPRAQQGLHRSNSDSAAGAASNSPFGAASRGDSRPPSVGGRQSFQNCPAPEGKAESTATDKATRQVKPPSNAEAGMRGQSQYAQFLHRSSVGPPANQDTDSQPLLRRSSSLGAANKRNAKPSDAQPSSPFAQALATILPGSLRSPTPASGPVEAAVDAAGLDAQKMERQPSRVYAVAAHQSADGDCDSADHVQEAASHREQMLGIGGGQPGGAAGVAYQPQAHPQVERKPPERQLTFQEMLRQQIEVRFSLRSPFRCICYKWLLPDSLQHCCNTCLAAKACHVCLGPA